jgi:hypothetical protein
LLPPLRERSAYHAKPMPQRKHDRSSMGASPAFARSRSRDTLNTLYGLPAWY